MITGPHSKEEMFVDLLNLLQEEKKENETLREVDLCLSLESALVLSKSYSPVGGRDITLVLRPKNQWECANL